VPCVRYVATVSCLRTALGLGAVGDVVDEQPGAFDLGREISEAVLDRLECADRLPQLVAFLHVADRVVERPPGQAEHPRRGASSVVRCITSS